MSAWNELAATFRTTYPTVVAASVVSVVQSPSAGLLVPNASLVPVAGTVVVVEVVRGVDLVEWLDVVVAADGDLLEPHPANARATRATITPVRPGLLRNGAPMQLLTECGTLRFHN